MTKAICQLDTILPKLASLGFSNVDCMLEELEVDKYLSQLVFRMPKFQQTFKGNKPMNPEQNREADTRYCRRDEI